MKKNRGITLIALVVTIVVLLILAGVSISMLTGENGIIKQAQNSKDKSEQSRIEELVSVAIGSVISKNNGNIADITPKMVADQINEDENRTDVYAENETTFPTNIVFPKENRKAEANLKSKNNNSQIYNDDVDEADIAPANLFDYEIINAGETGALTFSELPTRTVKITRVKPQYCNINGYNPDTRETELTDTNYEIIFEENKIIKRLVIPYEVDGKYIPNGIEGEYYKVTEVDLGVAQKGNAGESDVDAVSLMTMQNTANASEEKYVNFPFVDEIIYPNTVEKVYGVSSENRDDYYDEIYNKLKKVVLSDNIKEIPDFFLNGGIELTEVKIPENLTKIGRLAFHGCEKLTSLEIPKGVTSIGDGAFAFCSSLTNITIPDSVKSIGDKSFYECTNLTNITISENIEYIGVYAFEDTKFLENLPNGDVYLGKVYYKYNGNMKNNTIINIKEGTKSISAYAFDNCRNLAGITIPSSVTNIGEFAFGYCSNLTYITIPDGVTNIATYTFKGCSGLINITIPSSVTNIENSAFEDCSGLTKITIPSSVTSIGGNVFENCSSLTEITIPSSVVEIGYAVFENWTSNQMINIQFKENELPKGWKYSGWDSKCNAKIKYLE